MEAIMMEVCRKIKYWNTLYMARSRVAKVAIVLVSKHFHKFRVKATHYTVLCLGPLGWASVSWRQGYCMSGNINRWLGLYFMFVSGPRYLIKFRKSSNPSRLQSDHAKENSYVYTIWTYYNQSSGARIKPSRFQGCVISEEKKRQTHPHFEALTSDNRSSDRPWNTRSNKLDKLNLKCLLPLLVILDNPVQSAAKPSKTILSESIDFRVVLAEISDHIRERFWAPSLSNLR